MRIQVINPLPMQWVKAFDRALSTIATELRWDEQPKYVSDIDAQIFMWCNSDTAKYLNAGHQKPKKRIVCVRRYELYSGSIDVPWDQVDHVVMVNDVLCQIFHEMTGVKPKLIYNAVDPAEWTYKKRKPGKNIAWVGFVNLKKNLPLAIQIMARLPRDYVLHIAGGIQDAQVMDYAYNLGLSLKVQMVFYGAIPHEKMDWWLEDKNFVLNTSISEGCPNSVLEAMAKGIKPIVHNWPAAKQQFGESSVFDTIEQAVNLIESPIYSSAMYFDLINKKFGQSNYAKFLELLK